MPNQPTEGLGEQPAEDPIPGAEPAEDSTRILDKSRYLLGLTQTRISHLKRELERRRQQTEEGGDGPSTEETGRELEGAQAQLRSLQEKLKRSRKRRSVSEDSPEGSGAS